MRVALAVSSPVAAFAFGDKRLCFQERIAGFFFGKEFVAYEGLDGGGGKEMEAAGLIEESAGAEDVKVRMVTGGPPTVC